MDEAQDKWTVELTERPLHTIAQVAKGSDVRGSFIVNTPEEVTFWKLMQSYLKTAQENDSTNNIINRGAR